MWVVAAKCVAAGGKGALVNMAGKQWQQCSRVVQLLDGEAGTKLAQAMAKEAVAGWKRVVRLACVGSAANLREDCCANDGNNGGVVVVVNMGGEAGMVLLGWSCCGLDGLGRRVWVVVLGLVRMRLEWRYGGWVGMAWLVEKHEHL